MYFFLFIDLYDFVLICTLVGSQQLLIIDIFEAILFCQLLYLDQYNTFNHKGIICCHAIALTVIINVIKLL